MYSTLLKEQTMFCKEHQHAYFKVCCECANEELRSGNVEFVYQVGVVNPLGDTYLFKVIAPTKDKAKEIAAEGGRYQIISASVSHVATRADRAIEQAA
jgi:hypothetical protein